jgi:hypothetical protein
MNCNPSPFSANSRTLALVAAIRAISGPKSLSLPLVYSLPTTRAPAAEIIGSAASNMLCGQARSAPSMKYVRPKVRVM